MDKKNTLIGLALLLAGFGLMYNTDSNRPTPQTPPSEVPAQSQPSQSGAPANNPVAPATIPQISSQTPAAVEVDEGKDDETILALENDLIEARFSNYGGSLKEIVLKDFSETKDSALPYVMNGRRYTSALSITQLEGAGKDVIYQTLRYDDPNTIGFKAQISEQLEIERLYTISQETEKQKPYSIRHEITFRNTSSQPIATGDIALNIGTVAPSGKQDRFLLTFGHSDGEDVDFIESSQFSGGGFLGMFAREPRSFIAETQSVSWASVKNQFFITILTPDKPGTGFIARPVDFPISLEDPDRPHLGITGDVNLPSVTIPANATTTIGFDYYAGPKEHSRLEKMEQEQEKAMQFGFFGFISKSLLRLMNAIHDVVPNYGISIILLTLIVRTILLPVNMMSSKSMKRMSKLAEPMKLLKEKFPDNQQKQQMMMMELYKLNKVNPVAGCLPMLAQIPIFFALFYMLRSAAELRFEEFIWISDLSQSDTVAYIFGIPLNILPFAWVITMAIQMWTMPTPSVDNAQAKLMKFMPFIFFPFTYGFASGLVLYWTVSNVFTIGQQYLINKGAQDFEVIYPPALKKAMAKTGKGKKKK